MKARYRTKAIIGIGIWFMMLLVYAAVLIASKVTRDDQHVFSRTLLGGVAIGALLVQYVSYFWGFHHFAKGKGQSGGMIFAGILGPPVQFILFIILYSQPDYHTEHQLLHRPARRIRPGK